MGRLLKAVAAALALIAAPLFACGAEANELKRVLMLHSFGRDFKPWNEYATGIRAELDQRAPRELVIHDHSLIATPTSDDALFGYLHQLYADQPPDLIICIGAPAATFVQRQRPRLFPGTPMIFTAVEQRRVQRSSLTPNDIVVAAAHDFPVLFDNIVRVLPETRTIVVVNGASANEKFWLGELKRETEKLQKQVEFLWYEDASFEEILRRAAKLPPNTAIFWLLMNVDAAGVSHEGENTLAKLYAVATAPIFSHNETFFGQEIVGGPMHSVLEGTRLTAEVAIRVLHGEKASEIQVAPRGYALPKYDWRQLQRWGIPESRLPPGSAVLFRDGSVFEQYRWQIMSASAALVLQALLISGLLIERRRRVLAQVQSRQRVTELAHVNRRSLAGELSASISHELNQPLGAILSNVEAMELMLNAQVPDMQEIRQIAADIKRDDERASEILRRLRSLLTKTPFELKVCNLNDIVRDTVDYVAVPARLRGVVVEKGLSGGSLLFDGDSVQLQQVIMNLMLNAADAMIASSVEHRRIVLRTRAKGGFAELTVTDSGPGIVPEKLTRIFEPFFSTKTDGMGMGLSIARSIVEAHRGTISAENAAGGGAAFLVRLPLTKRYNEPGW